jgi:hypothetical protein
LLPGRKLKKNQFDWQRSDIQFEILDIQVEKASRKLDISWIGDKN